MSLEIMIPKSSLLNIGCGNRFHPAWTNLDFYSDSKEVISWDLRKGVPFSDSSFEVVYHSHLLEHFPRTAGRGLIQECFRVLKPGGILRVAVPDLERIARHYLATLERALEGAESGAADHEWMTLELYDQAVRTRPGGEIQEYLASKNLPNEAFILERWGNEASSLIDSIRNTVPQPGQSVLKNLIRLFRRLVERPSAVRERFVRILLGADYPLLELGRFRTGGSIHQWMYDRISLAALLGSCGFVETRQCSATESSVPDWTSYQLDTASDGTVYKPDSLFMEGRKSALQMPVPR